MFTYSMTVMPELQTRCHGVQQGARTQVLVLDFSTVYIDIFTIQIMLLELARVHNTQDKAHHVMLTMLEA